MPTFNITLNRHQKKQHPGSVVRNNLPQNDGSARQALLPGCRKRMCCLALFLVMGMVHWGSAQDTATAVQDSLAIIKTVPDSLPRSIIKSEASDMDTSIAYEASDVNNLVQERKTYLIGKASIKYKKLVLKAGKISLDWDNHLMTAEGIPDTVWQKTGNPGDSIAVVNWREQPVFIENGEEMHGFQMVYNYKTEKGRVVRGRTTMENSFYSGAQVKMITRDVFNVSHGKYTACDAEEPHYFFYSRRMKMMVNNKVIAKPVVFYLHKIPVAILPFAVLPLKRGRHSGIIMPRYGQSTQEGRYLRELGYYWAANDYFDMKGTVDFFEKTGWLFRSDANYALRYWFSGTVRGSLTRKEFSGGGKSLRWDLSIRHNQTIDQNTRFSANGDFVSDKNFYRDLSTNLDARLSRQLRSNATFSKSWPGSKNSITVNISQVRDLETDNTTTTLPQASFRMGQRQIFAPEKKSARTPQRSSRREQPPWYQSIYFSYNSSLVNTVRRTLTEVDDIEIEKKDLTRQIAHNASLSMSSPKKFFGWLDLSQSLNLNEYWYNQSKDYYLDEATNKIKERDKKGFAARHTFQYSASANTKLYGLVQPNIMGVTAIRHVVTPRLSFSFQPDFSGSFWGYFQEISDTTGRVYKKDRFGGTPGMPQKSMNIGVNNLFQAKLQSGDKEKKVDLVTVDLNTGYNFEAKEYRLSQLSSSMRANPAANFSLTISMGHDFYQYNEVAKTRVNKYIFADGGWLRGKFFRLTDLRFNTSLRLAGKSLKSKSRSQQQESAPGPASALAADAEFMEQEGAGVLEEESEFRGDRFGAETGMRGWDVSWRASLSFEYYMNRSNPARESRRYNLNISGLELMLSRNWRISYNAHFDLKERRVSHHSFTFNRDLHCWEATLTWVPSGIGKRYYFRINIKAPQLQDIKLERRGGAAGASAFGYPTF